MEQDTVIKIIGIIVIIAMVGSILAAGFLYAPTPSNNNNDVDLDQINNSQTQSFDYQISFNTEVLGDLDSIRIAMPTDNLNKTEIDLQITKINGVARVGLSQFIKFEGGHYYFAEIDLKKSANNKDVVENITSLEYFGEENEIVKKVSIATVEEPLEVYNAENDLNRKFTFNYPTTFAYASLDTLTGDEISVSGTISLKGKDVTKLELMQQNNLTSQTQTFMTEREFELQSVEDTLFFEAKMDGNIDQNYYDEKLEDIDSNMQKFFYNNSYVGQTTKTNQTKIQELFIDSNLDLKSSGTIFIEKTFVADLNKEFDINREVIIEISTDKKVGDVINTELTIYTQRGELVDIIAVEKQ